MLKIVINRIVPETLTYDAAISFLASNTVVYYNGVPYLPRGHGFPSYDISEVCCWLSEQPLKDGMRLCTLGEGSAGVNVIEPPYLPKDQDDDAGLNAEEMNIDDDTEEDDTEDEDGELEDYDVDIIDENIDQLDEEIDEEERTYLTDKLILISADCYEGLKKSLEYFDNNESQELIKDPASPANFVTKDQNPRDPKYYIWPNKEYQLPGSSIKYNSQHCFIYTRKMAVVRYVAEQQQQDSGGEPIDIIKEFVFVEANPILPKSLYVMAKNTIRLFRLNGRYYEHLKKLRFHHIKYNTSKSENEYDDLRLEGRMQAFNQARKSMNQLRIMRSLMVDQETFLTFIDQYQILLELTGYPSVWASVFNEGGDPGGFNTIMGIPAPVGPIIPFSPTPPDNDVRMKKDIVSILETDKVVTVVLQTIAELKKDPEFAEVNITPLVQALESALAAVASQTAPKPGKRPRELWDEEINKKAIDSITESGIDANPNAKKRFKHILSENAIFNNTPIQILAN